MSPRPRPRTFQRNVPVETLTEDDIQANKVKSQSKQGVICRPSTMVIEFLSD